MVEEHDGPRLNVDGLSKAVLRDSKVLSRIIAETVDEAEGLSLEEIEAGLPLEEDGRTVRTLQPELSTGFGLIVYDILVEVALRGQRVLVNVEAQGKVDKGMACRQAIYQQGLRWYQRFVMGRDYESLIPAYSIWVVMNPGRRLRNTVLRHLSPDYIEGEDGRYVVAPRTCGGRIVEINVGDPWKARKGVLKLAGACFRDGMPLRKRAEFLKNRFNIDLYDGYYRSEICMFATLNEDYIEGVRMSAMEDGKDEGRAEGIAEGRAEGRAEEMSRKVSEYAETVLSVAKAGGWTLEEAMSIAKVPETIIDDVRRAASNRMKDGSGDGARSSGLLARKNNRVPGCTPAHEALRFRPDAVLCRGAYASGFPLHRRRRCAGQRHSGGLRLERHQREHHLPQRGGDRRSRNRRHHIQGDHERRRDVHPVLPSRRL